MVQHDSLLCTTVGTVTLLTATALRNPLTGNNAVLPEGACVERIAIYRDGDSAVTGSCTIQLGVVGATAKYMATLDLNTTTQLNNGHTISRTIMNDTGLAADTELRITLSGTLTTGAIAFEISYFTYA
jgi:hypothetical protein